MVIYRIENDGFKYQELDLDIRDFVDGFPDTLSTIEIYRFSKSNLSLKQYWPNMATGFSEIEGNENLMPDIAVWIDATLLLSPKAYRLLIDLLLPYGEFLPIHIDAEVYQIFNCLTVVDMNSEISDKVVFKPDEDDEEFDMAVHCTDRLRNAIQSFDLRGVIFEEVD